MFELKTKSMKKILVVVFFMLTLNSTKAQQIIDVANFTQDWSSDHSGIPKYYKDINNHYMPYIGTWIHQVGNRTFVVTLRKATKEATGNPIEYYRDRIWGNYSLIENYNDVNQSVIYTTDTKPQCMLGAADSVGCGGYIVDFSLPQNGASGTFSLVIIGNNPTTAQWIATPRTGTHIPNYPTTFNFPSNVILTKIN